MVGKLGRAAEWGWGLYRNGRRVVWRRIQSEQEMRYITMLRGISEQCLEQINQRELAR